MSPPGFRVTDVTPESLKLHYYSKRPALWPIVKGVIQAMAKVHFKFDISLELVESRDNGTNDHEVFLVTYPFQQDLVDFSLEARKLIDGEQPDFPRAGCGAGAAGSCRQGCLPLTCLFLRMHPHATLAAR